MQTKRRLCVIALFLVIYILKTCALIRKRKFVRDSQFDGYSCTLGDTVKTFDNISNEIACIASCVEIEYKHVFYFPVAKMCQGCYTFSSNELQPNSSSEISVHYKPVLGSSFQWSKILIFIW